jgi:hypothetical protein
MNNGERRRHSSVLHGGRGSGDENRTDFTVGKPSGNTEEKPAISLEIMPTWKHSLEGFFFHQRLSRLCRRQFYLPLCAIFGATYYRYVEIVSKARLTFTV